jgi:hypothetical protein
MGTSLENTSREGQNQEIQVAMKDQQIKTGFSYIFGWKLQTITVG